MITFRELPLATRQIPLEELWELVCDLWQTVEQRAEQVRSYEAQLAQQATELAALRAQLAAATTPTVVKTSQNSSLPPASQPKATVTTPPTPRTSHHAGVSRPRQVADTVIVCTPIPCEQCGQDLQAAPRREIGRQQVVELPEVKVMVVELVRYARTCACGHCQTDTYPAGYQQPHQAFGPRLHALITYLNGTHHIAHDRLQGLLRDVFQLDISAGALVNSLQFTARQLEPATDAILQQIRTTEVAGSDETGLRCAGKNGWLWVVQTKHASYFKVADRRSGQVLLELLGEHTIRLWVCDLYGGQLMATVEQFAVCNAHQLRDLQYAIDQGDTGFAPAMQLLLREGLWLTRERLPWAGERYTAAVARIKTCARDLLELPSELPITQRLQRRFRKHFDSLWRFLDDPTAPFDNNASERALRPAVIHRKVVGGFRAVSGATAYARYRTVEDTARKQGKSIWEALFAVLGQPLHLPLQLAR